MTEQLVLNRIAEACEEIAKKGGSGGGGDNVEITPTLTEGTKIADYKINNQEGSLYAPAGGSGSSTSYVSILTVHEVLTDAPANSDDDNNGGGNDGPADTV